MLREELQGKPCPDQMADPIGYHEWFEANKCPTCNGTGRYFPESDTDLEMWRAKKWPCRDCSGKGLITEQFDPNF